LLDNANALLFKVEIMAEIYRGVKDLKVEELKLLYN
jgi:hypothetical protein